MKIFEFRKEEFTTKDTKESTKDTKEIRGEGEGKMAREEPHAKAQRRKEQST